jgi:hypothetical protein
MLRPNKPLLLIAPLVLALAAAGCGGGDSKGGLGGLSVATVPAASSGQANSGGTQTNSGGSTNNAQPTQAPANNGGSSNSGGGNVSNSEIAQLFTNFAKVKSFRINADVGGGQKLQMEVVEPDKAHYVITGGSTGNIELIAIGNDAYVKTGNTWIKAPGSAAGSVPKLSDLSSQVQKASSNEKGFSKGGTDTVNGKKCQIYTDNTDGGQICVADGLPLRVVTKGGSGNTTLIFSDYNANIDIKAPI